MAECSPVADAALGLACFLGSGRLCCVRLRGRGTLGQDLAAEFRPAAHRLGIRLQPAASHEGRLYIQVVRTGESFLLALIRKSGETIWRHVREDEAESESEQAYHFAAAFRERRSQEILVFGADCLTSHDPATGKELWRLVESQPGQAPQLSRGGKRARRAGGLHLRR
ncbi:MAG: PQQ-like beta-propeller repeat protein [Gammaproteobacteria bacterium]|nr:PQQ-like beta-propeller repeat protein [Gammaproteobacteria bacterium]